MSYHLEADAVDGDVVEHEGLEARRRVRNQHRLRVLWIWEIFQVSKIVLCFE